MTKAASSKAGQALPGRILVAEGNKAIGDLVSRILRFMGFEVAHAENGLGALAAFLDGPLDLVLIDLQIPIMNISSLAYFIKEVSPNTSVMLLTGDNRDTVQKQAENGAIDSVMFKPFDTIDFEKTVGGALELKEAKSPFVKQPPQRSFAVNSKRNPVWRRGKRNVFCFLYRECLDDAIKGSWQDWDCGDCPHKLNNKNEPDPLLAVTRSIEYWEGF